jgi:RNase P subunit RPR2
MWSGSAKMINVKDDKFVDFECPHCGGNYIVSYEVVHETYIITSVNPYGYIVEDKVVDSEVEDPSEYKKFYCDSCETLIATGEKNLVTWLEEHNMLIDKE